MNNEPHYILPGEEGFKNELLDICLATGYYRMQHLMFTSTQTQIDPSAAPLPVFWLREVISKIDEPAAAGNIRRKCSHFTISVLQAAVTKETEALYALYKQHITFEAAASATDYLHQAEIENPFDSWMIEVRDGSTLIAVGYFDKGKHAIAGILNFYHPAYKKYSLGKFLILEKIRFARANNMSLYYTGYLSTAITKFDYKLFPDPRAIEVYLPAAKLWVSYTLMGKELLSKYYNLYHV